MWNERLSRRKKKLLRKHCCPDDDIHTCPVRMGERINKREWRYIWHFSARRLHRW